MILMRNRSLFVAALALALCWFVGGSAQRAEAQAPTKSGTSTMDNLGSGPTEPIKTQPDQMTPPENDPNYGFSNQNSQDMESGRNIDIDPKQKSPTAEEINRETAPADSDMWGDKTQDTMPNK